MIPKIVGLDSHDRGICLGNREYHRNDNQGFVPAKVSGDEVSAIKSQQDKTKGKTWRSNGDSYRQWLKPCVDHDGEKKGILPNCSRPESGARKEYRKRTRTTSKEGITGPRVLVKGKGITAMSHKQRNMVLHPLSATPFSRNIEPRFISLEALGRPGVEIQAAPGSSRSH